MTKRRKILTWSVLGVSIGIINIVIGASGHVIERRGVEIPPLVTLLVGVFILIALLPVLLKCLKGILLSRKNLNS
jgi:hypothetical protein